MSWADALKEVGAETLFALQEPYSAAAQLLLTAGQGVQRRGGTEEAMGRLPQTASTSASTTAANMMQSQSREREAGVDFPATGRPLGHAEDGPAVACCQAVLF